MDGGSKINIKLGTVESVDDPINGGRIKVRLMPDDYDMSDLQYAYPLLPKMFNVLPKIGECVIVFLTESGNSKSNRYYIGPLISQLPLLDYEFSQAAKGILHGSLASTLPPHDKDENAIGAYANKEDVAIYSRKGSDIILKENDIRVRCGARIESDSKVTKAFNNISPSYLKLKYSDTPTIVKSSYNDTEFKYNSTATLVADQINLIGNVSEGADGSISFDTHDNKDMISDEEMKNIIANAHVLPYGDVLVTFLKEFIAMFKNHSHDWVGHTTILPSGKEKFWDYITGNGLDKMLSKNVRIN